MRAPAPPRDPFLLWKRSADENGERAGLEKAGFGPGLPAPLRRPPDAGSCAGHRAGRRLPPAVYDHRLVVVAGPPCSATPSCQLSARRAELPSPRDAASATPPTPARRRAPTPGGAVWRQGSEIERREWRKRGRRGAERVREISGSRYLRLFCNIVLG